MLRSLALSLALAVSVLAVPSSAQAAPGDVTATLEQSTTGPLPPGGEITYTLKFTNHTSETKQLDPFIAGGFVAPTGTTKVAASNDIGLELPPMAVNVAATLTVRIETVPNGTVIRQRPTPTISFEPVTVTPESVELSVTGSAWRATSATIEVSSTSARYPDEVITVTGHVTTNGAPYSRRPAELLADTGDGPKVVTTITTTDEGKMETKVQPRRGTKYSWRAGDATSPTKLVKVEFLVKAKKVKIAGGYKIQVKLGPAAKVKVRLQRLINKHWKVVAKTRTTAKGKAVFTVRTPGQWRYRVHVPAQKGIWDSSYSRVLKLRV